MTDERRASPRVATNAEIIFREKGSFIKSYMLNVSNGGVFIKTEHPLPLESVLTMTMQLPNDREKINIEGRVVWTNTKSKTFPAGMGIQFMEISPEHKAKIDAFVAENLTDIKKKSIF